MGRVWLVEERGPQPPPYLGHGGQGLVGGGAWPTAPAVSRSRWAGFGWWRSAAHGQGHGGQGLVGGGAWPTAKVTVGRLGSPPQLSLFFLPLTCGVLFHGRKMHRVLNRTCRLQPP